jgi:hypothetical protein
MHGGVRVAVGTTSESGRGGGGRIWTRRGDEVSVHSAVSGDGTTPPLSRT